ncbi:hypothetical protein JTB14_015517 [Gonioctena quinquepunctata]|nr:hypothetical protein JTB14_015517 [Gonioctena quinquepunctata]
MCEMLVLSHFNHCDVISDVIYGLYIDDIDTRSTQNVQNCCVRLIYGIRKCQSIRGKLQDIKWLNMHERRLHRMAWAHPDQCNKQRTFDNKHSAQ